MTTTPDYCILASDLKDIQTDFLLLQNPLLKDIPLINFVSNYTKKIINIQFIPAYFKGWLQRDKNNISALDRCLEVIFFCNSKSYSNISNIFSNQHLSVTLSDKKQPCFWEQTSPFIIANLLLLKYKQNLSEILPDKNIRKQIDSILNEISFLTAKNSEKFDSSQALASIYSIPSNYKCEIKYAKSFNNIFSALTDVNHFDTPTFHNLIVSASNNILV
jgi:hypothetical protein